MRTLGTASLLFAACLAAAQQPAATGAGLSARLSIPVEVVHSLRADKVHAGDPVEFRTLMAVLVSKELVMPGGTHLYGRVLAAGPKEENKNSYLGVVVERAEWKDHIVVLHAFIAAQLAVTPKNQAAASTATNDNPTAAMNRRTGRSSGRAASHGDPALPSLVRTPDDAVEPDPAQTTPKYPKLEDVGFFRDKDGATYLISTRSNVKLPAGVLLMLENR